MYSHCKLKEEFKLFNSYFIFKETKDRKTKHFYIIDDVFISILLDQM